MSERSRLLPRVMPNINDVPPTLFGISTFAWCSSGNPTIPRRPIRVLLHVEKYFPRRSRYTGNNFQQAT